MEGRKRRGRESGGGGKGKRGERNRSKKEGGGEGNREKRGGRQEGQWKGRNREKCFQWAGLLPDLLHCVCPAGDQRKVVGTWRENEDSEKVLGHADLSTYLNWRGSFL